MSIEIIKPSGGGGSGITSLNGLTASAQLLAVGTSGTDFAISSSVDTNTFNLPTASAINRGALSSADWTTFNSKGNGTVTSVQAITLGTTGTDLSSSVANGNTVPVITLNVPTASAANRGALSSADWSTFNGKQATLVSGTNIKTINSTSILGSGNLVVAAAPSGVSGAVQFSDGSALASDATNFFWDNANDRLGLGTNTPLGILHLKTAAATTRMVIDGGTSQSKIITYRTNGLQRFGLYTDNTAESGSNVGSDFKIRAYSDAGSLLTTPLFIKRSTGNIGINSTTATSKLVIKGAGTTSGTSSLNVTDSSDNSILFIRDDGFVGIGTTGPTAALSVTNNQDNSAGGLYNIDVRNLNANGQARINFKEYNVGANRAYITYGNNENILRIATTGSANPIYFGIADAPKLVIQSSGNVGIGTLTPVSTAALDVSSTTQGFLPPRMTTGQKNAIATPAAGLMVYDTTLNKLCVFTTAWETITSL
jgi:hypothetical protein